MKPVIEARGLVKRYGDFTAVAGIDFTVEEGKCFGLLGSNGAGKTSTIRMISCVSPVTEGELLVDGRSVRTEGRAIKAVLGVVPQEENLDEDLDVLRNLLVYARYFGMPSDEARRQAWEALEFMELADRARSPIDTLSGGMKRRLMIARALLNRPRVLMLDEPTTGLDPHGRHLVWERLHLLKSQATTMVLSTHYMEEAMHLCDRLIIMEEGRILEQGSPRELVARHFGDEVVELRVAPWEKEKALALLRGCVGRVADHGDALVLMGADGRLPDLAAELDHLTIIRRPPNLEDVFLVLTGKGLSTE
ncbi:MAG: ABC transporter ATP-binding protein [Dehalococcoidia bacterium]